MKNRTKPMHKNTKETAQKRAKIDRIKRERIERCQRIAKDIESIQNENRAQKKRL